jgi:hypothetical protein
MQQRTVVISIAVAFLTGCQMEQNTTPIFTKIHTVSIHVKNHTTHDAVYRFLREDLQLPVVYTPLTLGERKYVGLWAGNLVLEPCGPYSNITYATPDFTAMFYGITFESYKSSMQSATQLDQRGIKHEPPYAFVVISDPNLCGQNLIVSIMDNSNRCQEQVKHDALTSQLKENQGGPLGIRYIEEIQVGYTDPQDINAWKSFLAPSRQIGRYRWQLGDGPAIRLLKSDLKEIKAVVFRVASLESAVRYLETKKMLGYRNQNVVKVKTPDAWDFTIVLQE